MYSYNVTPHCKTAVDQLHQACIILFLLKQKIRPPYPQRVVKGD